MPAPQKVQDSQKTNDSISPIFLYAFICTENASKFDFAKKILSCKIVWKGSKTQRDSSHFNNMQVRFTQVRFISTKSWTIWFRLYQWHIYDHEIANFVLKLFISNFEEEEMTLLSCDVELLLIQFPPSTVVIKAHKDTPALDAETLFFLEDRKLIGMVRVWFAFVIILIQYMFTTIAFWPIKICTACSLNL